MCLIRNEIIAISPQFTAHIIDEQQVLLLSEQRSFRLKGKLYVALITYLDGKWTSDGLVKAFENRAPEELVIKALSNLLDKKYALYLHKHAPTYRQALWVELGLNPISTENSFSGNKVSVTSLSTEGPSFESAQALSNALISAGFIVVNKDDADLNIFSVEDYLSPELDALNKDLRNKSKPWMLFKGAGVMPSWGPIFRHDSQPCWSCLSAHMLENRPGDLLIDANIKKSRPAKAFNTTTITLAANFAALELARAVADDASIELHKHVISFDLNTRSYEKHLIRLNTACSICGNAYEPEAVLEKASAPLELNTQVVSAHVDGGWRIRTADQVVRNLERYVSPITGIISGLENSSPDEALPVFVARQTSPVHISPQANRRVGKPSGAAGKGISPVQAKASCLAEAMERYLCGFTGREPRKTAVWEELGSSAPHPYSYLNYSEQQYDEREKWNKDNSGFNWVGERFDEKSLIEWTPAWSLSHQSLRWLPTRFCYYHYTGESKNEFCHADSNGCASGSIIEEAILQGFFELVERDACSMWWYNKIRAPKFNTEILNDPFERKLREHCSKLKRGLHVLDLTNDLGIPVAISISYKLENGGSILLGLGAHFDPKIAISRSLAEINQMLALDTVEELSPEALALATGDEATMINWLLNHNLQTDDYCAANGVTEISKYPKPNIGDLREAINRCSRIVSDLGYDMIVLNNSRPEVDFAVARVVVPGLRHFWARFRQGRLYDTPVNLGWLDRPKTENDLNPTPFFL